jgi:hypothetical protein
MLMGPEIKSRPVAPCHFWHIIGEAPSARIAVLNRD